MLLESHQVFCDIKQALLLDMESKYTSHSVIELSRSCHLAPPFLTLALQVLQRRTLSLFPLTCLSYFFLFVVATVSLTVEPTVFYFFCRNSLCLLLSRTFLIVCSVVSFVLTFWCDGVKND
jgi:hypothetical protein